MAFPNVLIHYRPISFIFHLTLIYWTDRYSDEKSVQFVQEIKFENYLIINNTW